MRISVAPRHERAGRPLTKAQVEVIAVKQVAKGDARWDSVVGAVASGLAVRSQARVGRVQAVENTAEFVAVAIANVIQAGRAEPVSRAASHPVQVVLVPEEVVGVQRSS